MTMDALLSGPAGVALLIDESGYSSIHVSAPHERVPRRSHEVRFLLGEASNLLVLENVHLDEVVRRLEEETDGAEALQLALILLDSERPGEVRREAANGLAEMLERGGPREPLERQLFAYPLPPDADLAGAMTLVERDSPVIGGLLRDVERLQPAIEEIRRAWDAVPDAMFGSAADRRRLQAAAVREGLFKALVLACRDGAPIGSLVDDATSQPSLCSIESCREVVAAWTAPLRAHELHWEHATEVAEASDWRGSDRLVEQWQRSRTATEREESFRQIYLLFYRKIFRFFLRRGFGSDEAKDLTQDTFSLIHRNPGSFRGEARFETWLFKVAANLYKNRLRGGSTLEREGREDVSANGLTAGQALREESLERLYLAMADLPPQMRRCVMMRVAGDLKYREIAAAMEISVEAVKTHLYQARRQLKSRLADLSDGAPVAIEIQRLLDD